MKSFINGTVIQIQRLAMMLGLLLAVQSVQAQQNPAPPQQTPPADSSKLKFAGKITHWQIAYGMSGPEFMEQLRNKFKASAFAEVYIEGTIDHGAWMFTLLNKVTKFRYQDKTTPYVLFEVKFKPTTPNLDGYQVLLKLTASQQISANLNTIASDAAAKYLGNKTYADPSIALPDIEKTLAEAMTVLDEKLGDELAPNLMVRYGDEVFWNGHEIPITDADGNYVELEAIGKDGKALSPGDITWTNADPFQSKGVVDMTGVNSKSVTLTKAGDNKPLVVTIKRANTEQDLKELLKVLIVEALSAKKQQVIDTIPVLKRDSVTNAGEVSAQIALLEGGNYPLEDIGIKPTGLFQAPVNLSNQDETIFNEGPRNGERKEGFRLLRKRKDLANAIRKKVNVVAFANLVVDQPEKVNELLEALMTSSGRLIARLILSKDSQGVRDAARNIVVDFLNQNIERIAGGAFGFQQEVPKPLAVPSPPSAPRSFTFSPAEPIYISPLLEFEGKTDFVREMKDYLKQVSPPVYVVVNYSQDINAESYISRINSTRPMGIPEGHQYVALTVLNIPGSTKSHINLSVSQGNVKAFDPSGINKEKDRLTKAIKDHAGLTVSQLWTAKVLPALGQKIGTNADIPCNGKVLLESNVVAEFDKETLNTITDFVIENNRLKEFWIGANRYQPLFSVDAEGDLYKGESPTYHFADFYALDLEAAKPNPEIKKRKLKDSNGQEYAVYSSEIFQSEHTITLTTVPRCKDEEVMGDNMVCYTVKDTDCIHGTGGASNQVAKIINRTGEDIDLSSLTDLLSGKLSHPDRYHGQMQAKIAYIYLTSYKNPEGFQETQNEQVPEGILKIWIHKNESGVWLIREGANTARLDNIYKNQFHDENFTFNLNQELQAQHADLKAIATAAYKISDWLSSKIAHLYIPEAWWNCDNNEANKIDPNDPRYYNPPWFINIVKKILSPTSVIVSEFISYMIPADNILRKELERLSPENLTFALSVGVWDGVVGLLDALPQTIKLSTMNFAQNAEAQKASTEFGKLIDDNGGGIKGVGKMIFSAIAKQFSLSTPCVFAHSIGTVAFDVIVAIFTAGSGTAATRLGSIVRTIVVTLDKLDVLGALVGKVAQAGLKVAFRGTTKVLTFTLSKGARILEAAFENGKYIIRVLDAAMTATGQVDWSLAKLVKLVDLNGHTYTIPMFFDPMKKIDDAIYRMNKILTDDNGVQIRNEQGDGLVELVNTKTNDPEIAFVKGVTNVVSRIQKIVSAKFEKKVEHDAAEFVRQLKGQEKGMNELTVEEFIKNRDEFILTGRPKSADKAQREFRQLEIERRVDDNIANKNMSLDEATEEANNWITGKVALHDPDQIAGGFPTRITQLGDGGVNFSLGAQWPTRIGEIDRRIRDIAKGMTEEQRRTTYLDIELAY